MTVTRIPAKDHLRAFAFYAGLVGREAARKFHFVRVVGGPKPVTLELDCDMDEVLEFVWANGGSILNPEPLVQGDRCHVAIEDSEGNAVMLVASTREALVKRSA